VRNGLNFQYMKLLELLSLKCLQIAQICQNLSEDSFALKQKNLSGKKIP
jgi:hypothetical protein